MRDALCKYLALNSLTIAEGSLESWTDGDSFPPKSGAAAGAFLETLTEEQRNIVQFMLADVAGRAVFDVMNLLDGTTDVPDAPFGNFHLSFEHWDGDQKGQSVDVTSEDAGMLHDDFMEQHMEMLESKGWAE